MVRIGFYTLKQTFTKTFNLSKCSRLVKYYVWSRGDTLEVGMMNILEASKLKGY